MIPPVKKHSGRQPRSMPEGPGPVGVSATGPRARSRGKDGAGEAAAGSSRSHEARGSSHSRLRITGNNAEKRAEAVGQWVRGHAASDDESDNSDISTVEMQEHKDEIAPNRAHMKRGRSLRTNVLLRKKGVLMSGARESGAFTPGIVLTYGGNESINEHRENNTNALQEPFKPKRPTVPAEKRLKHKTSDTTTLHTSSGYPFTAFDSSWGPPRDPVDPLADTVWWGWAILFGTWAVFVMGMGSVLGVWEWVLDVGEVHESPILEASVARLTLQQSSLPVPSLFMALEGDDEEWPISGYYPALMILTMVMAWVWVITAWVGMKYFKHAKIQPQSD